MTTEQSNDAVLIDKIEENCADYASHLVNRGYKLHEAERMALDMQGYLNFWASLINQSIRSIKRTHKTKDTAQDRLLIPAENASVAVDWIFNYEFALKFDYLCAALNLNADAIRESSRPCLFEVEEIL